MQELIKRYAVLVVGLYLMTFGVTLSIKVGWGTTPLSTLPLVVSYRLPRVSFGMITFWWNMLLITGQIVLLRRRFQKIQLLQIPLSFLFGAMLNINQALLGGVAPEGMGAKIVWLLAACVVLAFSISLTIRAGVLMNSGEGFVQAAADTFGLSFGGVKVATDVLYVVCGAVLSLLFFGKIQGVGAGTAVCALVTGWLVEGFERILTPVFHRFFTKSATEGERLTK